MIQNLDSTMERLLREKVPLPPEQYDVTFDRPDSDRTAGFAPNRVTLNLYLYEIRENLELRRPEWKREVQPDGTFVKRRPSVRIDCAYLITAWSPADPVNQPGVATEQEHTLLSQVLTVLLRYPTIPPEVLQGRLVGQEPPLPTMVAQPDGLPSPAEFWTALNNLLRPSLNLVVTISIDPRAYLEPPQRLMPVVSKTLEVGAGVERIHRLRLRPSLREDHDAGQVIRGANVAGTVAARLGQAVFASARSITVREGQALRANEWVMLNPAALAGANAIRLDAAAAAVLVQNDWIWIQGNLGQEEAQADLVRITGPVAAGADVAISPALDFPHDAGREVRRATFAAVGALEDGGDDSDFVWLSRAPGVGAVEIPVQPPLRFARAAGVSVRRITVALTAVTALQEAADQDAGSIRVVNGTGLSDGDWLMIDDGEQTEFVRLDGSGVAGPVTLPLRRPLRFAHGAGRGLRRVTVGDAVTQLQQPANQPSATITLDSRDPLDTAELAQDMVVMVGTGTEIEFCRLGAIPPSPSTTVPVSPPLQNNHAAGIPLRRVTDAEVVGRLSRKAAAQATEVMVVGKEAAKLHPGDVIKLEGPAPTAYHQITAVTSEPGAVSSPTEVLVQVGGRVSDNATPPHPIAGARVDLVELNLVATTDAEGRFTFANLLPGTYTLRGTAPGYQDAEEVVQVPARSVDEYRITLSP
ncbi:MAG: Pvc16 family protein [Candidatus Methylomirabilales bacterium]